MGEYFLLTTESHGHTFCIRGILIAINICAFMKKIVVLRWNLSVYLNSSVNCCINLTVDFLILCSICRNRVQQIAGNTNNMIRRSGNVLPPPVDEFSNTGSLSTEKPPAQNAPCVRKLGAQLFCVKFT